MHLTPFDRERIRLAPDWWLLKGPSIKAPWKHVIVHAARHINFCRLAFEWRHDGKWCDVRAREMKTLVLKHWLAAGVT